MTGKAIGEIAAGLTGAKPSKAAKHVWLGQTRRTFAPVRRRSYDVADRRAQIFRPIANGTPEQGRKFWNALLRAAEQYDEARKEHGKVNGPLGHVALRVLRELGRFVNWKTGQLDPSLDTLMERTRRSRGAICSALARLKAHGFLDWVRRTEPIEDAPAFGPQVRQISNAYCVAIERLPRKAAGVVRRIMGWLSPKAAEVAAERAEQRSRDDWAGLSTEEQLGRADATHRRSLASIADALEGLNASSPNGLNPVPEGQDQKE